MTWQDITNSPRDYGNFFLVKPPGISERTGKEFIPTVVQRVNDEVFDCHSELEAIIWSHKDELLRPTTNVNEAGLLWHLLP